MSRFIQLHLLTSYPPSNLNRDDLGRPKTAMMGGCPRLRVSSQSLKRAWRTSDVFQTNLKDHIGERTKKIGEEVFEKLKKGGIEKTKAKERAQQIADKFGNLKKEDEKEELQELEIEQLTHFSQEEKERIDDLCKKLIKENREPNQEELDKLLKKKHKAVDIAMFGRMLAGAPKYNTEAAVQVAHAITVHSVVVEDDFFTAVDDLNTGEEDAGAGFLGETEFAAGLFYLYICIDKESLIKNLSHDTELADKTLSALVETAAVVAPTGKQNSFASRARASYIRCEKGDQQPRSLSVAFLEPVGKNNMLKTSIKALEETAGKMNKVYGQCFKDHRVMNALKGEGDLDSIKTFIKT